MSKGREQFKKEYFDSLPTDLQKVISLGRFGFFEEEARFVIDTDSDSSFEIILRNHSELVRHAEILLSRELTYFALLQLEEAENNPLQHETKRVYSFGERIPKD